MKPPFLPTGTAQEMRIIDTLELSERYDVHSYEWIVFSW